jgi:hypothetical protein
MSVAAPSGGRAADAFWLATIGVGVIGLGVAATTGTAVVPVLAALAALVSLVVVRRATISWRAGLAALTLVILLIPIRRYTLPGSLPFELEPYRVLVIALVCFWFVALLVDPAVRVRRTGLEPPLLLILAATFGSLVANPDRVTQLSSFVEKKLMFFLSFILVLYVVASVVRRLDDVDFLAKTLVLGGAAVGLAAMVEARTGANVFNHLGRVFPVLQPGSLFAPEAFQKFGAAKLRVFGSAEHPIALSAAFVLLTPLGVYLARRYRQKRWGACVVLLVTGCAATVSRTGIVMLVVVGLVFLWLRPRETRRLWPLLIPALLLVKLALPGTLGAIKQSFQPPGGLLAEQSSMPGESGSGRIADLGPALAEWKQQPLVGQGFGTRVVDPGAGSLRVHILDNQWLGTLLEVGVVGFFGWLWFFARVIRRLGAEAKEDDSDRGWLLASLAAGVAAYAVGMVTFDAFSFVQVTFLLFILVGLGSALLAERPTPLALRRSHGDARVAAGTT